MTDISRRRDAHRFQPRRPEPRSVVELIASGTLDAELAATLWLLIEARVPIVVAADARERRQDDAARRAARLPARRRSASWSCAAIDETFDWLPAGVRARLARRPPDAGTDADPDPSRQHGPAVPPSCRITRRRTPGARRRGSRSARRRSGTAWPRRSTATRSTTSSTAPRPTPSGSTDDELSRLGVVLVLRQVGDGRPAGRRRPLRPARRPRRARPRPATGSGRARDLGSGDATRSSTSAGA